MRTSSLNGNTNKFIGLVYLVMLCLNSTPTYAQNEFDCSPIVSEPFKSSAFPKSTNQAAPSHPKTIKKTRYTTRTTPYRAQHKHTTPRLPSKKAPSPNAGTKSVLPNLVSTLPLSQLTQSLFPATVIAVKGQAWNSSAQPLKVGAQLNQKDVIQTDANSFISIRLGDGTTSTLPSNSKIELGLNSNNVARFKLLNGRVENHVPKASKPKQNTFEIQLPRALLGVRGTQFMAEIANDNKQQVQVTEGIIAIQALGQCRDATILQAGEGAVIAGAQNPTVAPLLDAPRWIEPEPLQNTERMTFILEPVKDAELYQAQIATDPEFLNIQSETFADCPRCAKIRMGHVASQIPNGTYYIRFMALDKNHVTGKSIQYRFVRQRPQ